MDRNCDSDPVTDKAWVALRKESVDRNTGCKAQNLRDFVALRKESVDRNILLIFIFGGAQKSLSARRAWIEIELSILRYDTSVVALRKESVDRNLLTAGDVTAPSASLSARRAWIEIISLIYQQAKVCPSLSARRAWIEIWHSEPGRHLESRRSPQGERG